MSGNDERNLTIKSNTSFTERKVLSLLLGSELNFWFNIMWDSQHHRGMISPTICAPTLYSPTSTLIWVTPRKWTRNSSKRSTELWNISFSLRYSDVLKYSLLWIQRGYINHLLCLKTTEILVPDWKVLESKWWRQYDHCDGSFKNEVQ